MRKYRPLDSSAIGTSCAALGDRISVADSAIVVVACRHEDVGLLPAVVCGRWDSNEAGARLPPLVRIFTSHTCDRWTGHGRWTDHAWEKLCRVPGTSDGRDKRTVQANSAPDLLLRIGFDSRLLSGDELSMEVASPGFCDSNDRAADRLGRKNAKQVARVPSILRDGSLAIDSWTVVELWFT